MNAAPAGAAALVLLAAGGSTRMGAAGHKHARPFAGGASLPARALGVAAAAGVAPADTVVVLGAEHDAVAARLPPGAHRVVVNRRWAEGPGGSVAAGVREAVRGRPGDAAPAWLLLLLADQPRVSAADLRALLAGAAGSAAAMAGAAYGGTVGAPACFGARHVPALLALAGAPDRGAAALLRQTPGAAAVPMPHAAEDVDTPAQWEALTARVAPGPGPGRGSGPGPRGYPDPAG